MKGFCKELSDMQALQEPALQEGDGWEKMARQMGARRLEELGWWVG